MFDFLKKLFHHEQTSKREKIISAVLAFGYVIALGMANQKAMQSEWYQALIKPDVQPPDAVFAIVWTILFVLIGLSGYFAWNFYASNTGRKLFAVFYALNGLLMAAWTHQFFVKHSVGNGVISIVGLIIVIEAMIITGFYTNKKSSYLLLPYLLWILFAMYLNIQYLILNP